MVCTSQEIEKLDSPFNTLCYTAISCYGNAFISSSWERKTFLTLKWFLLHQRERKRAVECHFIFKVNYKVLIRSSEQGFYDALCLRVSDSI